MSVTPITRPRSWSGTASRLEIPTREANARNLSAVCGTMPAVDATGTRMGFPVAATRPMSPSPTRCGCPASSSWISRSSARSSWRMVPGDSRCSPSSVMSRTRQQSPSTSVRRVAIVSTRTAWSGVAPEKSCAASDRMARRLARRAVAVPCREEATAGPASSPRSRPKVSSSSEKGRPSSGLTRTRPPSTLSRATSGVTTRWRVAAGGARWTPAPLREDSPPYLVIGSCGHALQVSGEPRLQLRGVPGGGHGRDLGAPFGE